MEDFFIGSIRIFASHKLRSGSPLYLFWRLQADAKKGCRYDPG